MKAITYILFLCISLLCNARNITLQPRKDIQSQLVFENTTYELSFEANLKGSNIKLPKNSTLKITNEGKISNGCIAGNNSKIIAGKQLIFDNIKVEGTWNNSVVYSQWVHLYENSQSNNEAFKLLMKLCEGKDLTHFYLQRGIFYVSAIYRSAPILVPSNVYWHNQATIKMLPNKLEWYNIVYIHKSSDVTIDGGVFEGDIMAHQGTTGEWGHGIKCGGASNTTLKNLVCKNCWGDGIDLIEGLDNRNQPTINCRNITIDNVKCVYNRRQGLSIEAAADVLIINSEFAYTGSLKSTIPSSGIDIEPWSDNMNKVWNIKIKKCSIHSNKGEDLLVLANLQKKKKFDIFHNNLLVTDCQIGSLLIGHSKGITIEKTQISNYLKVQYSRNVHTKNSFIKKVIKGENVNELTILQ